MAVAVIEAETNSSVTRRSSATSSAEKTHYHAVPHRLIRLKRLHTGAARDDKARERLLRHERR
ncbi:MAG: hypothetical protein WA417_23405 [Stellaceae bacterium]